MSNLTPILTLSQTAEKTISWTMNQLKAHGFHVERTFDLHSARLAHVNCPCPHHGTEDCSCQMVILLINGMERYPVTLVLHGNANQTCLSLVETENQPVETKVIELLEHELEKM